LRMNHSFDAAQYRPPTKVRLRIQYNDT
jgi:hypothetical protein